MSAPANVLTCTMPGPTGELYHYPRPTIVALSASLRRSGVGCGVVVRCSEPSTRVPAGTLEVRWATGTVNHGSRGCLRLLPVQPTAKGSLGSVVDFLPIHGLTSRPMPKAPAPSGHTRAFDLRTLKLSHPLRQAVRAVDPCDDWTAREALARETLGADWERVQAA